MGLRLPLDRIPYIEAANFEEEASLSPIELHNSLPTVDDLESQRIFRREMGCQGSIESLELDPSGLVRTALTAEVREGILHVFMPPTQRLERWFELLHSVHKSAEACGLNYKLEGYAPPVDNRINQFKVTPDPGVLEINIHPASNWG